MQRELRVGDWVTLTEERQTLIRLFAFGDKKSNMRNKKVVMRVIEMNVQRNLRPNKLGNFVQMSKTHSAGEDILLEKTDGTLETEAIYNLNHATEAEIKREQLKRLFPN